MYWGWETGLVASTCVRPSASGESVPARRLVSSSAVSWNPIAARQIVLVWTTRFDKVWPGDVSLRGVDLICPCPHTAGSDIRGSGSGSSPGGACSPRGGPGRKRHGRLRIVGK